MKYHVSSHECANNVCDCIPKSKIAICTSTCRSLCIAILFGHFSGYFPIPFRLRSHLILCLQNHCDNICRHLYHLLFDEIKTNFASFILI